MFKIHIFIYSVSFRVYTGGAYIEVVDKLAEDAMNPSVQQVKAFPEYAARVEVR